MLINNERMNREISGEVAVIAVILFLLFAGGICGWAARCLTVRDKVMVSNFERSIAERDYFNAQLDALVKGEKK